MFAEIFPTKKSILLINKFSVHVEVFLVLYKKPTIKYGYPGVKAMIPIFAIFRQFTVKIIGIILENQCLIPFWYKLCSIFSE
jgi:hypothetical protein